MSVPIWLWIVTIAGLVLVVLTDLLFGSRHRAPSTARNALCWLAIYIGLGTLFGAVVWLSAGALYGGEFFGGYLTEYSLSVDNLFVFMIIMSTFKVPAAQQHRALLLGIVIALVLRALFIVIGVVAINALSWLSYLFAALLFITSVNTFRQRTEEPQGAWTEPRPVRLLRSLYPTTAEFHGARLTVRLSGRRWLTPMFIVIVAIGITDLLFAFDSIPAIFGITREPFLICTANAFALMALRHLYILLHRILEKLRYLSYGLAAILAFIGVKMVLHALNENELPFLNGGKRIHVPEPDTPVTLSVITGVLAITALVSFLANRRDPVWRSASTGTGNSSGETPTVDASKYL